MEGLAMNYEYLVRRAFNCGRYGAPGADADTYRAYERKEWTYRNEKEAIEKGTKKFSNPSLDELANEAGIATGKIIAYIVAAIEKVIKDYDNKLSQQEKEELEELTVELLEPTKEIIEKVIKRSEEILVSHKIFPG